MSQGMKLAFIVHAVVALIFGVLLFLIPDTFGSWFGMTAGDATTARTFGAAILGLSAGSWLASQAKSFEQVRIKLAIEIVYGTLGALATLYELLFGSAPAAAWLTFIILAGFAVIWVYYYRQARA